LILTNYDIDSDIKVFFALEIPFRTSVAPLPTRHARLLAVLHAIIDPCDRLIVEALRLVKVVISFCLPTAVLTTAFSGQDLH
jgi:hypothetical protein